MIMPCPSFLCAFTGGVITSPMIDSRSSGHPHIITFHDGTLFQSQRWTNKRSRACETVRRRGGGLRDVSLAIDTAETQQTTREFVISKGHVAICDFVVQIVLHLDE